MAAKGSTRSVILLSGGMDSATVLAIAQAAGDECYALSFAYGQRHDAELAAAQIIGQQLKVAGHRTVNIDMGQFGGSALTDAAIANNTNRLTFQEHAIPRSKGQLAPFTCFNHLVQL